MLGMAEQRFVFDTDGKESPPNQWAPQSFDSQFGVNRVVMEQIDWSNELFDNRTTQLAAQGVPKATVPNADKRNLRAESPPDPTWPFSYPLFKIDFPLPEFVASTLGGRSVMFEIMVSLTSTVSGSAYGKTPPQEYVESDKGWSFEVDVGKIAYQSAVLYVNRVWISPHVVRLRALLGMVLYTDLAPDTPFRLTIRMACSGSSNYENVRFYHLVTTDWVIRAVKALFRQSEVGGWVLLDNEAKSLGVVPSRSSNGSSGFKSASAGFSSR